MCGGEILCLVLGCAQEAGGTASDSRNGNKSAVASLVKDNTARLTVRAVTVLRPPHQHGAQNRRRRITAATLRRRHTTKAVVVVGGDTAPTRSSDARTTGGNHRGVHRGAHGTCHGWRVRMAEQRCCLRFRAEAGQASDRGRQRLDGPTPHEGDGQEFPSCFTQRSPVVVATCICSCSGSSRRCMATAVRRVVRNVRRDHHCRGRRRMMMMIIGGCNGEGRHPRVK